MSLFDELHDTNLRSVAPLAARMRPRSLDEFAGQALFVGPTAYFRLSESSRLTLAWSVQAWGRSARSGPALDLVDFERHQARLVFGVNF